MKEIAADVLVAHELVADDLAAAVDEVEDAGGYTRLLEDLGHELRALGRLLGGLEDDRVAGHERGRDLPDRDRDGEIPGR